MLDHIDLKNVLQISQSVAPQDVTADVTGSAVDLRQCEAECLVVINVGDVTSLVATVKLQSSLNDNTANAEAAADAYTDISGASLVITGTENGIVSFKVDTRTERYVKAVIDWTSGSGIVGVSVVSAKRIL